MAKTYGLADLHLIGKEIVRASMPSSGWLFPMAADLPLPKQVLRTAGCCLRTTR